MKATFRVSPDQRDNIGRHERRLIETISEMISDECTVSLRRRVSRGQYSRTDGMVRTIKDISADIHVCADILGCLIGELVLCLDERILMKTLDSRSLASLGESLRLSPQHLPSDDQHG
jgi:hypothetical protein